MATSVRLGTKTPDHGAGFVGCVLADALRIAAKPPKGACLVMWGFSFPGIEGQKLKVSRPSAFSFPSLGLSRIDGVIFTTRGGKGGFEVPLVSFFKGS